MNQHLISDFTKVEVKEALSKMNHLGASGPDGFPTYFYWKNWRTVDKNISQFMLNSMNTRGSLESINNTFITLILKIKNPLKVGNFRPISFYNVLYKIIAKVLTNRLKFILHDIISPTQSAFIPDRLITNNILIVYETLHSLNSQYNENQRFISLKLDISKSYDCIEWVFLQVVMSKLGFHSG